MRKRFMMAALVAALAGSSVSYAQKNADPEGYLSYSLPSTVLVLEVEAVRTNFYEIGRAHV